MIDVIASDTIPDGAAAEHAPTAANTEHAAVGDDGHNNNHSGGHSDPFSMILLELAVIILLAIFGRWIADKYNQPAVLGELIIGVVVGNIGYYLKAPLFTAIPGEL